MKRLAVIPTAFALVAMVAACADMAGPGLSDGPLLRVTPIIPIISVTCVAANGDNLGIGSVPFPAGRAGLPAFRAKCTAAGGHLFPGVSEVS